jgi:hypothetical protein
MGMPGAVPGMVLLVACVAWDLEPEAGWAALGSSASGVSGALAWFRQLGAMRGRSGAEEFTGKE